MICPRCKCEIGNQPRCPYCGATFRTVDVTNTYTTPIRSQEEPKSSNRHLANIDTWNLVSVVLLSGIFITDILQLVLQLSG